MCCLFTHMIVTPAVAPSTQQGLFSCESLQENSMGGIKHCSKKTGFMGNLKLIFPFAPILKRNYKSLKLVKFCLLNHVRNHVCFKTVGKIVGTFPRCFFLRDELASQKIMRIKLALANPLSTPRAQGFYP